MLRDNVNAQVACAVLLLIGAVVVDNVGASTKYTLLGKNQIEVTESMVTCKNGKSVSVTTGVKGELYALSTTRTEEWRFQHGNVLTARPSLIVSAGRQAHAVVNFCGHVV
uniref:ACYPI003450 protein n=1 Tax=Acyrthosiphon pisum TaxID=7029 RepID=C4WWN9_ACYPI|nr:ACYPI003450 [Acyrthosiphon pisum]